MGEPFIYAPIGGSRIPRERWALFDKDSVVCNVASRKTKLEGHQLRHRVAKEVPIWQVTTYGENYAPLPEKLALKGYCFQVVIENCQHDGYFTEKLIDAFAVGSIPIYWGGNISKFFDMDGVITFDTIEGLKMILDGLDSHFYNNRRDAVKRNLKLAEQYRCPEDWIFRNHAGVFR